jgi:hypothetical protein
MLKIHTIIINNVSVTIRTLLKCEYSAKSIVLVSVRRKIISFLYTKCIIKSKVYNVKTI